MIRLCFQSVHILISYITLIEQLRWINIFMANIVPTDCIGSDYIILFVSNWNLISANKLIRQRRKQRNEENEKEKEKAKKNGELHSDRDEIDYNDSCVCVHCTLLTPSPKWKQTNAMLRLMLMLIVITESNGKRIKRMLNYMLIAKLLNGKYL